LAPTGPAGGAVCPPAGILPATPLKPSLRRPKKQLFLNIFKCLITVFIHDGVAWWQVSKFGGGGSGGGGWLKDVGVRTVQAFSQWWRQAGRTPSSFTNCAAVRLSSAGPGVHPIKCHVLPAVPTARRKNCFKVSRRENFEIPGQVADPRWVSRRAKAGAIVTTTFSAAADWQADTRL